MMSVPPLQMNCIGIHPPGFRLPESARVGRVRLAVSSLQLSVAFYTEVIGLSVLEVRGKLARLGAQSDDRVLLELEEIPGVEPLGRISRLGLYHTAFLLPTREDLSSFVRHLVAKNVGFGSGDHIYSEALYLVDPDGLSVEVYADRPRSEWIFEGVEIVSATNPVRFAELPKVADDSWKGAPKGTTVGHVHLYVGDLKMAAQFYSAGLGLDIVTWRYPGALFMSAGGYHHHVGLNVWAVGSPVASDRDSRLLCWEMILPNENVREEAMQSLLAAGFKLQRDSRSEQKVSDPWGITVSLAVEGM